MDRAESGEAVAFQLKNCVILLPGVRGWGISVSRLETDRLLECTFNGGGRECSCVAVVLEPHIASPCSGMVCLCTGRSLEGSE